MKTLELPLLCQWDITDKCNLHCKMCRNGVTKREQQDDWKQIGQRIVGSGVVECSLAGGEPLMHPHFKEIVGFLSPLLRHVNVLTNGTLIDKNTASFLSTHSCQVQVSIDGGSQRVHDGIRGAGSFLKTSAGIGNLKSAGVKFTTQLTITELNRMEIANFVQFSSEVGAESANIRRCIPIGSGRKMTELDPNSLKSAYETAFQSGRKFGIKISAGDYFASLCFDPEIKTATEDALSQNENTILGGCSIGWTAFYVRWDGVVTFCPYLPVKCGDLLQQDFQEIWEKSETYHISRNLRWNLVGKCSGCRYLMVCGGCPAAAYNTTGSILDSDPQCWI